MGKFYHSAEGELGGTDLKTWIHSNVLLREVPKLGVLTERSPDSLYGTPASYWTQIIKVVSTNREDNELTALSQ